MGNWRRSSIFFAFDGDRGYLCSTRIAFTLPRALLWNKTSVLASLIGWAMFPSKCSSVMNVQQDTSLTPTSIFHWTHRSKWHLDGDRRHFRGTRPIGTKRRRVQLNNSSSPLDTRRWCHRFEVFSLSSADLFVSTRWRRNDEDRRVLWRRISSVEQHFVGSGWWDRHAFSSEYLHERSRSFTSLISSAINPSDFVQRRIDRQSTSDASNRTNSTTSEWQKFLLPSFFDSIRLIERKHLRTRNHSLGRLTNGISSLYFFFLRPEIGELRRTFVCLRWSVNGVICFSSWFRISSLIFRPTSIVSNFFSIAQINVAFFPVGSPSHDTDWSSMHRDWQSNGTDRKRDLQRAIVWTFDLHRCSSSSIRIEISLQLLMKRKQFPLKTLFLPEKFNDQRDDSLREVTRIFIFTPSDFGREREKERRILVNNRHLVSLIRRLRKEMFKHAETLRWLTAGIGIWRRLSPCSASLSSISFDHHFKREEEIDTFLLPAWDLRTNEGSCVISEERRDLRIAQPIPSSFSEAERKTSHNLSSMSDFHAASFLRRRQWKSHRWKNESSMTIFSFPLSLGVMLTPRNGVNEWCDVCDECFIPEVRWWSEGKREVRILIDTWQRFSIKSFGESRSKSEATKTIECFFHCQKKNSFHFFVFDDHYKTRHWFEYASSTTLPFVE